MAGPWEQYSSPASGPWDAYRPKAAPKASPLPQGKFGASIEAAALAADPNLQVTGRGRTPERNRQVGGVANSAHLSDNARDFAPRNGESLAQAQARLNKDFAGKGYKVLAEGAGARHSTGPHLHVEATGSSQDIPPWEQYAPAASSAPPWEHYQAKPAPRATPAPNRAQRPPVAPAQGAPRVRVKGLSNGQSAEQGIGEWALGTIENIPSSAAGIVKGAYNLVRHPIDTAKGVGNIIAGGSMEGADFLRRHGLNVGEPNAQYKKDVDVAGQRRAFDAAAAPFTSLSGFKKALHDDPVGTALTVVPAAGVATKLGVKGATAAKLAGMSETERAAYIADRSAKAAEVGRAKNVFRTVLARYDLDAQRAGHELEQHQRVVGNAPVGHQRAIIKAVESASNGGVRRLAEEYRPAARAIRDVAQRYRERISEVMKADGKAGPNFITDYYARMWKQKPSEVQAAISHQGSGRNLRARRIPTYEEGLAAGLTPVHENPLDAMTAYVQNMSRFLATHDLQNKLRAEGLAKWVSKHKLPAGWQKLDGINTERDAGGLSKDVEGIPMHTGDRPSMVLAAPKGVANIFNRHVDKGLSHTVEEKFGERAGKGVAMAQKASDTLASTKLAFSAFHPALIAGKGVASDMGNAIRHISHLGGLAQFMGLRPLGMEYTNPQRAESVNQWIADKAWQAKRRADMKAEARKH